MEENRLPEEFVVKMRELLGEEAEDFFAGFQGNRRYGLRINPLKAETGLPEPFAGLKPIPWTAEGRYYGAELRPGKHPLHEAGCFYIQEPSAMAVAEALEPAPGEKILDLCAAPGGKSTQIAGRMGQRGLLVCNEIHPARARILSQNVERLGIGNAVVTNMEPAGLLPVFPDFFDGIVVDAPCSGEGMFRKDEEAKAEWSPEQVKRCAGRQDGILDCAAEMVRPGGRIVYSTCTFSPEENEQTVDRFLNRHPEFSLRRPACAGFFSEGRPEWAGGRKELKDTVRIWPHKTEGEGHFLALFVKDENAAERQNEIRSFRPQQRGAAKGKKRKTERVPRKPEPASELFSAFCQENLKSAERLFEGRRLLNFGDQLYLLPEEMPELSGIRALRPGLQMGTIKKGRLEPAHGLALFLKPGEVLRSVEIGTGEQAERYLRGEALPPETLSAKKQPVKAQPVQGQPAEELSSEKGWTLVTAGGFSIGWAKAAGGLLKNHYPRGLRRP